jgi:hypothetical protein
MFIFSFFKILLILDMDPNSVADPGCLYRILSFPSRIKEIPDPGSASKNLSIFNPKIVSKL